MTTQASDVLDLFLSRVEDYYITTLYNASGSIAVTTYLEPFLLNSINEFDICNQPLNYTITSGSQQGYFDRDLTTKNQLILSKIMTKFWMERSTNNTLQMKNFLQDKELKTYSQAQNLKAKQDYLNVIKEEISQLLVDYANKEVIQWDQWDNQIFK